MKLNISFLNFKKNHKNKKDQILYIKKRCKSYERIENLFRFLLVEKNSFLFESVEKGKVRGRYTIIGLNPDKLWNITKNKVVLISNNKRSFLKVNPLNYVNNLIKKFKIKGVSTRKPEGITNSDWVLIDAYDIIIHLFRPEVREFYALEKMWEIPRSTNSEIKTK